MLVRALLTQSKFSEAAKELERAEQLGSRDCTFRVPLAITKARLQARTQQTAAAQQGLASVLSETKARNLDGYGLEARLAQGEIELLAGDQKSARLHLKAVQADAAQRHFLLIARKARALAQAGKQGAIAGM